MSSSSATEARVGPRGLPPFRADHVGSLLRPRELVQARAARKAGTLSADALRAVEDRCIATAIRQQEELGLRAATDGEYRRAFWHYDFVAGLDGVELYEPEQKIQFKGGLPLPLALRVVGKIGWGKPVMVDDFRFVAGHVKTAMPKMTIPSPSVVHFRGGRQAIDPKTYPDMDGFFADLGEAYNKAVAAFGAAGCKYLQLDEVNIAYLCDPEQIAGLKARGEHVENSAVNLCRDAEPRDRGEAGWHDDKHASVPGEFSVALGGVGWLRAGGRGAVQPDQLRCVFHGV